MFNYNLYTVVLKQRNAHIDWAPQGVLKMLVQFSIIINIVIINEYNLRECVVLDRTVV